MKTVKYFFIIPFMSLFLLAFSCYPVSYKTLYQGGYDPLFNISQIKTIGFTSFCWTEYHKALGYDELAEKRLYILAKDELEKRGFHVFFISKEFLEYNPDTKELTVKSDYDNMPDLTLTLYYGQSSGTTHVPGKTVGTINWRNRQGGGLYKQTEGYDVTGWAMFLTYTLWSGSPKYMNKVWEGTCMRGSSTPDLFDKASAMTREIFLQKFDR